MSDVDDDQLKKLHTKPNGNGKKRRHIKMSAIKISKSTKCRQVNNINRYSNIISLFTQLGTIVYG